MYGRGPPDHDVAGRAAVDGAAARRSRGRGHPHRSGAQRAGREAATRSPDVVADHPRFLDAWAALGDAATDPVERYAAYRVGYHRGLDALRANGWRGSGYVRWAEPTNVGFLRCVRGLQAMAAAIGETDEAERCAQFLQQLDPAGPPVVRPPAIGGAVLCGGRSSRFGTDKALVEVDGRPMAEQVAAVLETAGCAPVVFVGGDGDRLTAMTGREVVADTWPGEGPLGAVVDALRWFDRLDHGGVVVAACDLPELTVEAVQAVAGEDGAVAVAVAGRPHPSLAYWPTSTADEVEALFRSGVRAVHEALDALGATRVAVAAAALHNVNRPSDLGD